MSAERLAAIARDRGDPLGLALLTLAQEMWVMKDRQLVLEAMLRDKGVIDDPDSYQPTPELAQIIADERQRFIAAITTLIVTGKPADT